MTLDRDALHAAILANPADDLPRLAYADWLEEHGDEEARVRARFIRLQVRLEALEDCAGAMTGWWCDCERCVLVREEGSILGSDAPNWPANYFSSWTRDLHFLLYTRVREATPDLAVPPPECVAVRFRRGFVADLVCHPQQWFGHHAELLSLYPLEHIAFIVAPTAQISRVPPRNDLVVRLLVNDGLSHELTTASVVVSATGSLAAIETAKMRICHQMWPGLSFRVCKSE